MSDEIEKDLAKHMERKIKAAIHDYVVLCDTVDIPLSVALPGAMASLLYILVPLVRMSSTMTADDFAEICRNTFESHKRRRQDDRGE